MQNKELKGLSSQNNLITNETFSNFPYPYFFVCYLVVNSYFFSLLLSYIL